MVEIIPAILEKDWSDVEVKLNIAKEFTDWIQLDIMDGIFVPEKSWANPIDLKRHLEALPSNIDLSLEVDMMLKTPENTVKSWIEAGVKRVIIHIESTDNPRGSIRIARDAGVEVGIALNIDTLNQSLDGLMEDIDFVQFMGIAKIGFQGQPFDKKVLHKIGDLRTRYPSAIISVDGGVNMKTAELLMKAGADRLIAGSAVFASSGGAQAGWKELSDLVKY